MQIQNKVVVVTGGANGIGRALCRAFATAGARKVIVADLDEQGAKAVAAEIKGVAIPTNVGKELEVQRLVSQTTKDFSGIDIFCSNAGVAVQGGPDAPDAGWQRSWDVNVQAHIYAARAVLPQMLDRKEGYLVQTVSAAGLVTQVGSAPYSVTKHAAMAFAEWLAITYYEQGVRVSALCPQGVKTNMLSGSESGPGNFLLQGALEPEQVAADVLQAIKDERFLILPHPEVLRYFQNKASDYERWLKGMRRLQAKMAQLGPVHN